MSISFRIRNTRFKKIKCHINLKPFFYHKKKNTTIQLLNSTFFVSPNLNDYGNVFIYIMSVDTFQ